MARMPEPADIDIDIDLDLDPPSATAGARHGPPSRPHRALPAAAVALICLLALVASVGRRQDLGEPLWTGTVSLNGFTLGSRNLYLAQPDGTAVVARDLVTGRVRWSHPISGLPDNTADVGSGVAVVTTRMPSQDSQAPAPAAMTMVGDAGGEWIAQTTGDFFVPAIDGRLLVFSRRLTGPDACAAPEITCLDVASWDLRQASVAWRASMGPNDAVIPSSAGGAIEALAVVDPGGTVVVLDASTGETTGSLDLPSSVLSSDGQIGLVRDLLLTAERGAGGVTVTSYRRPSLDRYWSVLVPTLAISDSPRDRGMAISDCGPDACLFVRGSGTWVLNVATGATTAPITFEIGARLGNGVFLVGGPSSAPVVDGSARGRAGFAVDATGRTVASLGAVGLVDWIGGGDRGLLTEEGRDRTGFVLVDAAGRRRSLGSVPGVQLTCHARGDLMGCSDRAGGLRVWRLPV